MTMRTRNVLVCECGHIGSLVTSENDQPYSTPWESHRLEGFTHGPETGSVGSIPLNPQCTKCGSLKVNYAPRI
jgi:hypothetical protein